MRKLPKISNDFQSLALLQVSYHMLNRSDTSYKLERQTKAAMKRNTPKRQVVCLLPAK